MRLLDSSGEDPKATAELVAERSKATLVDVRGSVAVLCEKRYFAGKPMSVE
jgi:RNA-binding protein YhbY